jgi:hypothetical protein
MFTFASDGSGVSVCVGGVGSTVAVEPVGCAGWSVLVLAWSSPGVERVRACSRRRLGCGGGLGGVRGREELVDGGAAAGACFGR